MTNYLIFSATNWGIKVEPNPTCQIEERKTKTPTCYLTKVTSNNMSDRGSYEAFHYYFGKHMYSLFRSFPRCKTFSIFLLIFKALLYTLNNFHQSFIETQTLSKDLSEIASSSFDYLSTFSKSPFDNVFSFVVKIHINLFSS